MCAHVGWCIGMPDASFLQLQAYWANSQWVINTLKGVTKYIVLCLCSLSGVFILEQGLGLLFTDDGGFDLRWVHVHVEFPTYQQTHCRSKFSLCFQHLRRLLFDDKGTAEKTHTHTYIYCTSLSKKKILYINRKKRMYTIVLKSEVCFFKRN